MDLREQPERAADRYRRTAAEREEIRRRQEPAGTPVAIDSEDQLRARAARLLSDGEISAGALSSRVAAISFAEFDVELDANGVSKQVDQYDLDPEHIHQTSTSIIRWSP
jgi:hypothetical protein